MEANGKQVHVDSMDEEIVARVAAIDVAKDSGMVCTRVPHPSQPGRRTTTVWGMSARTSSIIAVADRLGEEHVERVVLEATSDCWRPFCYLLEARALVVWVVNACDVKNVPGRPKTKTSSTPSGWPSSTSVACCGLRSSRRSRLASCVTTPGCEWT
jgi:transposase